MIALEIDETEKDIKGSIIKPIVICDFCKSRIIGAGNALWSMPISAGRASGPISTLESTIFHVHKYCTFLFEVTYEETNGATRFYSREIWELLIQTINNTVITNNMNANKNFYFIKRSIEEEKARER